MHPSQPLTTSSSSSTMPTKNPQLPPSPPLSPLNPYALHGVGSSVSGTTIDLRVPPPWRRRGGGGGGVGGGDSGVSLQSASESRKHRRKGHHSTSSSCAKKPPSTYHDFRGDVRTQDIFAHAFRAQRPRIRILYPGQNDFELSRYDVWNLHSCCTPSLILQPKTTQEVGSCVRGYAAGVQQCVLRNRELLDECDGVDGDDDYNDGVSEETKSSTLSPSPSPTTSRRRKKVGGEHGDQTKRKLEIPRLCIAGGKNSMTCMLAGAIVLDMSLMRKVSVDRAHNLVTVEGGARVLDLDRVTQRYGLMAVTGTWNNLGVVGCLLSGGIGYGSRRHGLSCDNVVSAEVVLGDGEVVQCCRHGSRNVPGGAGAGAPPMHDDLFWSLLGGGGGVGVVTRVTLRCYPLRNVALLSFRLVAPTRARRRNVLRRWAQWTTVGGQGQGQANDDTVKHQPKPNARHRHRRDRKDEDFAEIHKEYDGDCGDRDREGLPKEVFSQLILCTSKYSVDCVSTSIDSTVVPQSEWRLEQFQYMARKHPSVFYRKDRPKQKTEYEKLPVGWYDVPGLRDLTRFKFGALVRKRNRFRMMSYHEELQFYSAQKWFHTPGNVFVAYKYVKDLTPAVIDVLVEATLGKHRPRNKSRIYIMLMGGAISEVPSTRTAFFARQAQYFVVIEGRWMETNHVGRNEHERIRTVFWVQWVSNALSRLEGVSSTTHPESLRDQVPRALKERPHRSPPTKHQYPRGWYNFDSWNGAKFAQIRKEFDPRSIFGLGPRVSWPLSHSGDVDEVPPDMSSVVANPGDMCQ